MNKFSKFEISRRSVLKAGVGATTMLAAPAFLRRAYAADDTVTIMGVETAALDDWSQFEKATGVKVQFEGMASDPGIFRQEVVANTIGDRIDILLMDGGIEDDLGEKGFFLPLTGEGVPSWSKVPADVLKSPLAQGPTGTQFGLPVVMNADSFAYYPDEIGEAEPLSYSVLFDSEKTKGRVALENNWMTTFPMAATYVNASGRHKIVDPSNMTAEEAKAVADFLIERKNAGQFRTFWSTWEESVDLLSSKEVIAINCWEPAVLEVQKKGGPVRYATSKEGYNKWMICAYVPKQVADRNKSAVVAKALEGFLGGAYASRIATLRGYATALPETGLAFAKENNLPADEIKAIEANIQKVKDKFTVKDFWQNAAPSNLQAIEAEFDRFRNA